VVKKGENETKKMYFHKTKINPGPSAAAWFQEALVSENKKSEDEE